MAILYLSHLLISAGTFHREELQNKLGISQPTFHRYVAEIRRYYDQFEADKKLVYSRKGDSYYLKDR
jgi:hypothetical protein